MDENYSNTGKKVWCSIKLFNLVNKLCDKCYEEMWGDVSIKCKQEATNMQVEELQWSYTDPFKRAEINKQNRNSSIDWISFIIHLSASSNSKVRKTEKMKNNYFGGKLREPPTKTDNWRLVKQRHQKEERRKSPPSYTPVVWTRMVSSSVWDLNPVALLLNKLTVRKIKQQKI